MKQNGISMIEIKDIGKMITIKITPNKFGVFEVDASFGKKLAGQLQIEYCNGIFVFSNAYVNKKYREQGILTKMNKKAIEFCDDYDSDIFIIARTYQTFVVHHLEKLGFKNVMQSDGSFLMVRK